ncbi:MAG: hypothetical protein AAGI53_15600 [Planctomycetota bacterium]
MRTASCIVAVVCGFAASASAFGNMTPTLSLGERRLLANSQDQINRLGWSYQVGSERVVLYDRPAVARRAGEVPVWVHEEPVFDPTGNGVCPDAVNLFGQLFPDDGVNPPTYEAWEATAQFEPDTVIDTIQFAASMLPEPPATAGNGITDGVPFNDVVLIFEDNESAVTNEFTPGLARFGLVLRDLSGSDVPPPAGQVDLMQYTVDLTADDLGTTTPFETADTDGMAEEACTEGRFNPFAFLDLGIAASYITSDTDSLHDATYTMFFLQPLADYSGQINPQSAPDRAQIQPQGFLLGFGGGFVDPPTDAAPGSFNLLRLWDLTVPPAMGGPDFTQPFTTPEWLDEGGDGNLGGGFLITPTSRIDFFDQNPCIEAETGLSPFDFVCDSFTYTCQDGTTTVTISANGGSEPAVGFYGPTPGTCDADAAPCNVADLALPFGLLDLSDGDAFIAAFLAGDPAADIAFPFDVIDLTDVDTFIEGFLAGCP